jgi:hypothetical protein
MSAISTDDAIHMPSFRWGEAIRALLRAQPAPPGWWRAAFIIYLADLLVIAACIACGHVVFGDALRLFREWTPGTLASVAALAIAGAICLRIARRIRGNPLAAFWSAFGPLLCIVAADDLFSLHEVADRYLHYALRRDRYDRVTDHVDNLFVGMYALPALYLAVRHRKLLIEARLTLQVLAVAFILFAAQLVLDALILWPVVEESLKLTAGCTIMVACLATLMQPSLPASWTSEGNTEVPAELRIICRWVRSAGVTAFLAEGCLLIAALFTHSAALRDRDANQQFVLHACSASLLIAAVLLFYAGHRLSAYAARLVSVEGRDASRVIGPALLQASAWRAGALSAIGILGLAITVTIWACRVHVPEKPERKRARPKPTTVRHIMPK